MAAPAIPRKPLHYLIIASRGRGQTSLGELIPYQPGIGGEQARHQSFEVRVKFTEYRKKGNP